MALPDTRGEPQAGYRDDVMPDWLQGYEDGWGAAAPAERTAYARLDAPERVPPNDVFDLTVGLAASRNPGVAQPSPLVLPTGSFTLTVEVVAPGFRILEPRCELLVTPDDPYPSATVWLVAEQDPALSDARTVLAVFRIGTRLIGVASRAILVSDMDEPGPATEMAPGVDWVLPAADDAPQPDLVITVVPGNDRAGERLVWTWRAPGSDATTVDGSRIEPGAAEWSSRVMRGIEDRDTEAHRTTYLRGVASEVADAIPAKVWQALRTAAAAAGGPPAVLLATDEPYVPWELARVRQPWDSTAPGYLGAQAVVGRWLYSAQGSTPAPPARIDAGAMAVVRGRYRGGLELEEAEREAERLCGRYRAEVLDALLGPILECLHGAPPADIVHFAVHGNTDRQGDQDGILMSDDRYLDPYDVQGVEQTGARLVFLNACQLGRQDRMLGRPGGMVPKFIGIGAGALVAPLWKVDDAVAREVAEAFYRAVLLDGVSPADQLRRERCRTGSEAGSRLAYIYFGHPRLAVTWTGTRDD